MPRADNVPARAPSITAGAIAPAPEAHYAATFPDELRSRLPATVSETAQRKLDQIASCVTPLSGVDYQIVVASGWRIMVEIRHASRSVVAVEVRGPNDP